ncbi:hypothetical protein CN563_15285 [Bacillus sp. AFS026049]|nr:hypothetical protein CON84_26130 [Bacillus sp. AFS094228]PEO46021.1 hypothetical protein CN563_15285 [Bacillus sp. AFS026049]
MRLSKRIASFFQYSRITFLNEPTGAFVELQGENWLLKTPEDIVHLNTIKGQNPYGMLTLLLGLASFIFGPQYIIIPIVSLLLGFITYRTFDSETEKNPSKGFWRGIWHGQK